MEKPVKFKFKPLSYQRFLTNPAQISLLSFTSEKVFVGFKGLIVKQRKEERQGDICSHFLIVG